MICEGDEDIQCTVSGCVVSDWVVTEALACQFLLKVSADAIATFVKVTLWWLTGVWTLYPAHVVFVDKTVSLGSSNPDILLIEADNA